MVYKWGFSCLNYPLEVSISWICLLSPYNYFCHICLSHHFMPYSCSSVYAHDTVFNTCFWLRFIDTHVLVSAHYLVLITPLVGEFLAPLDLHVHILEFGPWWTSCWSEWHSGSVVDQRKTSPRTYPSKSPWLSLEFFFYNSWASFILFKIVYLLYPRICAYRWYNILIILCHILW